MNERQKKFAEYYAQSGNASWSAKQAGYADKFAGQNADKLLKNTKVAEYIRELSENARRGRILNVEERQEILSDIALNGNNQDRIRAIDTLNKMSGEYVTKIEGNVNAEINNPSEELRKLAD